MLSVHDREAGRKARGRIGSHVEETLPSPEGPIAKEGAPHSSERSLWLPGPAEEEGGGGPWQVLTPSLRLGAACLALAPPSKLLA